ncbi:MAG: hypothetical protein K6F14_04670 [Clostridiales bacterium]|nr:hypothetical protein [Clostridiales bacterium]
MKEMKVFCEHCRIESECVVYSCELTGTIRGVDYKYKGKEAICKKCGRLVFVPEINDENLDSLYSVYRKANNIVSLEDVRSIPKKYNIGKKPLSLLLGWGEQTLSRYMDGDVPSKHNSEVLKELAINPISYLDLLEANKEKISAVVYEKSKKAADALIREDVIRKENRLCTCCMEVHDVPIVRIKDSIVFKGVPVEFYVNCYYCELADEYYESQDMLSENDIAMKDAYRKKLGLLTTTDIHAIRSKYGISQSDLCVLLGWGGKTITRYEGHQVQDNAHDSILKKLDSDPEWFIELLEKAKPLLNADSYERYYSTATKLLTLVGFTV